MSLSAKTLSPFMLWPGCCALPRQDWQAWGGGSNASLPAPRMSLGVEDYSLIPPVSCPPLPGSLLSTMLPWGAAWSS